MSAYSIRDIIILQKNHQWKLGKVQKDDNFIEI